MRPSLRWLPRPSGWTWLLIVLALAAAWLLAAHFWGPPPGPLDDGF